MNERHLIAAIAELWVESGGDLDGYKWSIRKIHDEIERIIDLRDVHNGCDDLAVNPSEGHFYSRKSR